MQLLSGRDALEDLRHENLYVFHGSPDGGIERFSPKKLVSRAESKGVPVRYDESFVFATEFIDLAIFAAVVFHVGRSGWYTHSDTRPVSFTFHADETTINDARNAVGYVYVFNKERFIPSETTDIEHVTTHDVSPVFCVRVDSSDLNPPLNSLTPDPDPNH